MVLLSELLPLVGLTNLYYDLPNLLDEVGPDNEFELTVSLSGEGPDGKEVAVEVTLPMRMECYVEDLGIGPYEYGGVWGNDTQEVYSVVRLAFVDEWPDELHAIRNFILKDVKEHVEEMEVEG